MNDWSPPSPSRFVESVVAMHYSSPRAEAAWQRILGFFEVHLRNQLRARV
jgi:carboxymethylenebutenolidase